MENLYRRFSMKDLLEIDPSQESDGKFVSKISFEGLASRITSFAFGEPELKDLYVT